MDIKGYRIEKVIGRGGMATVYLAVQTALERHVALKVMNPAFANDREFTTRFLQEGPIAARLSDPQIVTVYDSGVDQKHYYLAMEYLPGGTLKQKIREGLSVEKTLNIIKLVAKGLAYAHSQKVLHRDIKPQNILFRASGEPVLTDFGIAKALTEVSHLTIPGTAFGSPKYMSPEQAKGAGLDHRSDLYSLGVVFYEMLCGRPPFESKDAITLAQMHITNAVPPLPDRLAVFQPLIDRLLSKNPNARYQSAEQFLSELKDVRHRYELDISANRPSLDATQVRMPTHTNRTMPPPTKRSSMPKLLTGLAVLAVAAVGGAYIYQTYNKNKPPTLSTDPATANNAVSNAASDQPSTRPSAAETALAQARTQQEQGNLEQSLQTVQNALQQAPAHAQLLLLENELEQTLAAQQSATSQAAAADAEAKLADALAKARQLRRQGELEQSLTLVHNALQEYPGQSELLALEQELQITIKDLEQRRQAAAYLATAQKALQQDDLDASLNAVEQGLALIPGHLELLALKTQIGQKQAALALEQEALQLYQQAQQQLQQNQLSDALNSLQEALDLKPEDEQLIALREEILALQAQVELERQLKQQIAQLLEQAQSQFNRLQLTTPEGNNAFETYQQVLAQDPNNQDAQEGLSKIATKYYELADQAHVTGDAEKVLDYLNRGLSVQSDNDDLLALQSQIQKEQTARHQLALARELFDAQQLEDSLSAADAGLAAVNDNADLLALRSEIMQALDRREKKLIAESAVTEAQGLAQQNDWAQALAVLDRALVEVPQNADLIALQEQLRQAQSRHEQELAAAHHLSTAQQLLSNSELGAAYAEIQQGLQLAPGHSELQALKTQVERKQAVATVLDRAQAFTAEGKFEEGMALTQRGLELEPENPLLLSLHDQLAQSIEAQRMAAEQATTAQTSQQPPQDDALAASDASNTGPDLLVFGEGLASLAQTMGLRDAESFLRNRVETLSQTQKSADSETPVTKDQTLTDTTGDAPADNNDESEQTDVSESIGSAMQTATAIDPPDPLQQQVESLLDPSNAQAETELGDDAKTAELTENTASDSSQTDEDSASSNEAETDLREAQITELLQTAEARYAELNLTTPRGQSAIDAYRQILQLDPSNLAAQQGVQQIVNRYQQWAVSQRDKGNFERSLNNIDKALQVDPDNRELKSLRQTVVAQQQAAAEAAQQQAASTRQTPASSAADPCAIDRGSKECWCKTLKMFCN